MKIDNIYDTIDILFNEAYSRIDESTDDEELKIKLYSPLYQIQTLLDIQKSNLTYDDIVNISNVVFIIEDIVLKKQ